ncbi:MAG: DUF5819 family protein [Frankiaceae bacterium]|nr:DUF5819 family protein [Frankiaceae bacterium]
MTGAEAAGAGVATGSRAVGVRLVVLGMLLVTGWHLFASTLWMAPPTPLRELVPGNLLTRYMIPWFGQSWSVFAPEPINGDYGFNVKALLQNADGSTTETDWISASQVEQQWETYNLFPPRAANLAGKQSAALKNAYDVLNSDQKATADLNFFEGDAWLGRERDAMLAQGQNNTAVINYIVQARYSDAYATQVARAVWGNSVIRVQFEATRQNVIPYTQRNDPNAQRPPIQHAPIGWRGLIVMPGQDAKAFADTFKPAYDAYVANHGSAAPIGDGQ